jgi:tetratricopeptide (TPR) repeat protein
MAADLARLRSRLPNDTARTRRLLDTEADLARPSALTTVARSLRRPRFSPLTLAAAVMIVLFGVWAYAYLRKPAAYKPRPEAVEPYEKGVAALREGAPFKASVLLGQAVGADPDFAVAHARLGEALMEMDFLDRAREQALNAQHLAQRYPPKSEDALYIRAVTSTVLRQYPQAVEAYAGLAKMNPERPESYFDLGRAYELNNETDKAVTSYTKAFEGTNNEYAPALLRLSSLHARRKNIPAALQLFDTAESLYREKGNREGEAEAHYQRGRLLVELKRIPEARRSLDRARELAHSTENRYQQVQILHQLIHTESGQRALDYANEAITLADASGMAALHALGYVKLAGLHLEHREDAEAEKAFQRAFDLARAEKVRRVEALALLHHGQWLHRNDKPEGQDKVSQAREFYLSGGYRKEADSATIILSRMKRSRGDFNSALADFNQQIELAVPSGDTHQLGVLHRERGAVHLFRGNFPDALKDFDEAVKIFKLVGDPQLLAYSQLVRCKALWQLGRYEEAGDALRQVAEFAGDPRNPKNPNKALLMSLRVTEAQMELSRLRYTEAAAAARAALALAGEDSPPSDIQADANAAICLSEAFSGGRARAAEPCRRAVEAAEKNKDPSLEAATRLSLARALLEGGDARGARDAALLAADFLAHSGSASFEWQAQHVSGLAGQRAGGEDEAARARLARAGELISHLETVWGADAFGTYLSRPDLHALRRKTGEHPPASR